MLVNDLNLIQKYLTLYMFLPICIIGNFGNIINLVLFYQQHLRLNSASAWYFIGLSLANLMIIDTGGITRCLPFLTGYNLETTSVAYCKWRYYCIQFTLVLGRYFICLISIDRWIVTSPNESVRRLSSPKVARYLVSVGPCFWALVSIHAAVGFDIKNNQCYTYFSAAYDAFYSVYNLLIVIMPIMIMVSFSMLIIRNLRQRRHLIEPGSSAFTGSQQTARNGARQINMHLIRLVLMQSLTFIVLNISYVSDVVYAFITKTTTKSSDRLAIEAFIYGLATYPVYAFCSVR